MRWWLCCGSVVQNKSLRPLPKEKREKTNIELRILSEIKRNNKEMPQYWWIKMLQTNSSSFMKIERINNNQSIGFFVFLFLAFYRSSIDIFSIEFISWVFSFCGACTTDQLEYGTALSMTRCVLQNSIHLKRRLQENHLNWSRLLWMWLEMRFTTNHGQFSKIILGLRSI